MLKSIVKAQDLTEFDRAHFVSYGESSLDFEVVYHVLDPNYNVYMDIHQAINFSIFKKLEQMEVQMAYPTRTLFVSNDANIEKEMQADQREFRAR